MINKMEDIQINLKRMQTFLDETTNNNFDETRNILNDNPFKEKAD
jgi:hypothetical protein